MGKNAGLLLIALVVVIGAAVAPSPAAAQRTPPASGQGPEATDDTALNFLAEHEIGRRFQIDPAALPAPKTGAIVSNRSLTVPYDGQMPQVPPGFTATLFASGLANPRRLLVLPNGDVLVAEQSAGYLTLLRDDGEGRARWINRHVDGLNRPYGLAWRENEVLVADQDGIWRVPHNLGSPRADGAQMLAKQMLTGKGVFGIAQGHNNRPLAIDPKRGGLFAGVGSVGNIGVEPDPKATIQRFDADGSNQTTVAAGMRNPTALAFHPQTGELWAGVQERDGLGDNLPSDYLARIQQGGFYGWPYAYTGKHPQPGFASLAPDKVNATITPDLLFKAHSSLLDLVFYEANLFPAEYRGNLFVALKGSWNRSVPTGYKVVRVPFKDGKPEGYYENFATGFWAAGERRAEVWGRPAALAVAKDGALLVADDTGGTIWRISYKGP
jgi:glucose/arabinose dehydrogenase